MSEIRQRARARRKELGLTQEETAERAAMSPRAYQMFEAGKSRPQRDHMDGILRTLGMDDDAGNNSEAEGSEWPDDVRVTLDVIGAYMTTMDAAQRAAFRRDLIRRIFNSRAT